MKKFNFNISGGKLNFIKFIMNDNFESHLGPHEVRGGQHHHHLGQFNYMKY
jgi:hypothetical protein